MTDAQFIARLRRSQRHRRPIGIGMIAIDVPFTVAIIVFVARMHRRVVDLVAGFAPDQTPTTQALRQSFDAVQLNIGFAFGAGFMVAVAGAFSVVLLGFQMLFQKRKDRLLLELLDERAGGTPQGPAETDDALGD